MNPTAIAPKNPVPSACVPLSRYRCRNVPSFINHAPINAAGTPNFPPIEYAIPAARTE